MKKKQKGLTWGVITAGVIALFLSGKIISIPHGTHSGSIMSANGVIIIIISMIIIITIYNWLFKKNPNRDNVKNH